jgi:hypothetical protein
LLPNGKVLVEGGYDGGSIISSAELYDPASGSWTFTGSLNITRDRHTATLLPNGKVLVAGGTRQISGEILSSAELYDPASGTWTLTGNLNTARTAHTATLLPNGKVLVAGGGGSLGTAELYDPESGTWTVTDSLNVVGNYHPAMLLPNGKVLVAGGDGVFVALDIAKLYDTGLGFVRPDWQPQITTATSPLITGSRLILSGSLFQGISQASSGNFQDSSTNYPLVQLLSLTNEQTLFLPVDAMAGWSDTSFTSQPLTIMWTGSSGFPVGYALVTVFTNGIPGQSQFVLAAAAPSGDCTVCHKRTQTLVLPCNSMEYRRHLDHGDIIGECPPSKKPSNQPDSLGQD